LTQKVLLHHLRYPGTALSEIHRVLAANGRVIIFDPCVSALGFLVYGPFHHEPIGFRADIMWAAPEDWDSNSDTYYAAQGNAYRIFYGDQFRESLLGWKIVTRRRFAEWAAEHRLALYGFEVAFPHPGLTAEWYLKMRKKGWGRRLSGPLEEPAEGIPASGVDSLALLSTFSELQREEMVMTAKQMVKGFDEQTATFLIQVLSEIGVPAAHISSLISRMVFLEKSPEDILENSFDYVRSVLVPLRRGYGQEEGRIRMISETTSQIMTQALGQQFDFAQAVQEPAPEDLIFTI